jgi:hypothetical protein
MTARSIRCPMEYKAKKLGKKHLQPTARLRQAPLVAFVTLYQSQKKAFETPPLAVTDKLTNTVQTVPLQFSVFTR